MAIAQRPAPDPSLSPAAGNAPLKQGESPIGLFHVWSRGDPLPALAVLPGLAIAPVDAPLAASEITGIAPAEAASRLRQGHRLWLARVHGEIAGWGWSASHTFAIGELGVSRRLPPGVRYLWDFFTLPAWRGRRIYPHLLRAIVTMDMEASRFWLGHDLENEASRRGIARAGFQEVGALYRQPDGAFILVPSASLELAVAAGELFAVRVARSGATAPQHDSS